MLSWLFISCFVDWQDEDSQKGLGEVWSVNKVAKVAKVDFDASTLHDKPDLAAQYQLPDDGSGEVKVRCHNTFILLELSVATLLKMIMGEIVLTLKSKFFQWYSFETNENFTTFECSVLPNCVA